MYVGADTDTCRQLQENDWSNKILAGTFIFNLNFNIYTKLAVCRTPEDAHYFEIAYFYVFEDREDTLWSIEPTRVQDSAIDAHNYIRALFSVLVHPVEHNIQPFEVGIDHE